MEYPESSEFGLHWIKNGALSAPNGTNGAFRGSLLRNKPFRGPRYASARSVLRSKWSALSPRPGKKALFSSTLGQFARSATCRRSSWQGFNELVEHHFAVFPPLLVQFEAIFGHSRTLPKLAGVLPSEPQAAFGCLWSPVVPFWPLFGQNQPVRSPPAPGRTILGRRGSLRASDHSLPTLRHRDEGPLPSRLLSKAPSLQAMDAPSWRLSPSVQKAARGSSRLRHDPIASPACAPPTARSWPWPPSFWAE